MKLPRAIVVAGLSLFALLFPLRSWGTAGTNLLEAAKVTASKGVDRPELAHDGRAPFEGGAWDTTASTRFRGADAFVTLDLGSVHAIDALVLQADNDDDYLVDTSLDGDAFQLGWRSGIAPGGGLRSRSATDLGLRARYLRIHAMGGDGNYAVGEIQAFETAPTPFPPEIPRVVGVPIERNAHNAILTFGLAFVVFLLVTRKGFPTWTTAALALFPLYATLRLVRAIPPGYPLEEETVSLMRGVVALVATLAIARETFGPERFAPDGRVVVGVLAVCGFASLACFYNLGTPQFWDTTQGRPTFVHYLDLRQYFTTAKYFREIGYRHIYEADIASYLEDDPSKRFEDIAELPMRDLESHRILTIGELRPKIETAKARFSPERWEAYKKDARFLRDTMGQNTWLGFLIDYGGNATPVWISIAHILFSQGPASEQLFLLTGLFDPLLLLATFFVIGRTFGVRTALVCMVIFGTNDFIMYGSDWAGATLRHDWLSYLGLGACALRRERWFSAGAWIAAAAMIRAFPGIALLGAALPAAWWVADYAMGNKRLPPLALLRKKHGYLVRVFAGAAICAAALFTFSTWVVPPAAWIDWFRKVALLSADVHPTHVGLRSVVGGWGDDQADVLRERAVLFATSIAFLVALVLLACRRRGPSQSALLALLLVPVVMYPANYYMHLIFLIPMAATVVVRGQEEDGPARETRTKAWIILLLLSFAQYFVSLEQNFALHFFVESSMLLVTMVALLGLLVVADARTPADAAGT